HPRTNQINTTPSAADTMPATRNDVSGLSNALAASRFAARGKAANSNPSITSTRPIATRNWAICRDGERPPLARRRAPGRRGGRARRAAAVARLARRVAEVAEEVGIGLEQHARVVGAQARLIGLHRPIEREEVSVPSIRFGEDAIALGVALAARLLALGLR